MTEREKLVEQLIEREEGNDRVFASTGKDDRLIFHHKKEFFLTETKDHRMDWLDMRKPMDRKKIVKLLNAALDKGWTY
jgi:hypothetical protein